ncbi:hypothetical protein BT69DRAFT_1347210 [Atractiella rhizophila]|nr:hypothetical protein BT69DRAFT_1347210 [Atractiella rhizophila]
MSSARSNRPGEGLGRNPGPRSSSSSPSHSSASNYFSAAGELSFHDQAKQGVAFLDMVLSLDEHGRVAAAEEDLKKAQAIYDSLLEHPTKRTAMERKSGSDYKRFCELKDKLLKSIVLVEKHKSSSRNSSTSTTYHSTDEEPFEECMTSRDLPPHLRARMPSSPQSPSQNRTTRASPSTTTGTSASIDPYLWSETDDAESDSGRTITSSDRGRMSARNNRNETHERFNTFARATSQENAHIPLEEQDKIVGVDPVPRSPTQPHKVVVALAESVETYPEHWMIVCLNAGRVLIGERYTTDQISPRCIKEILDISTYFPINKLSQLDEPLETILPIFNRSFIPSSDSPAIKTIDKIVQTVKPNTFLVLSNLANTVTLMQVPNSKQDNLWVVFDPSGQNGTSAGQIDVYSLVEGMKAHLKRVFSPATTREDVLPPETLVKAFNFRGPLDRNEELYITNSKWLSLHLQLIGKGDQDEQDEQDSQCDQERRCEQEGRYEQDGKYGQDYSEVERRQEALDRRMKEKRYLSSASNVHPAAPSREPETSAGSSNVGIKYVAHAVAVTSSPLFMVNHQILSQPVLSTAALQESLEI